MYCPNCAKEVTGGLSFCNHCGFRLKGARDDDVVEPSEVKAGLLVSAMVGLFILGLVAIAILIGVMKVIAGFDTAIVYAFTIFSFVLLLIIEGLLTWMLLRGKVEKEVSSTNQLDEQGVKEMYAAPTRELAEPTFQPVASVTEHTTRTLEHVPKKNQ